ncbi:MAG TPA: DNA repair protein RecN [bacterium]|nr:DNA repair protein RecN [bacterium]
MLTRLVISNLATIASLAIDFESGFTVLTGETGAGKSILIDALRFALGGRAAADQVRTGARQTLVEAVFDVSAQPDVTARLEELGIPCSGELTVRRLLQESGRSRALANDCAITQARLEELGRYLVNIHGQHDNQMLLDDATHIDFLDAYGGLLALRAQTAEAHGAYLRLLRERKSLREQAGEREHRRDELALAVEELRAANPAADEETTLREEHARLTHADQLAALMGAACDALSDGELPISARLGEVAQQVQQAASIDARLRPQAEQVGPLLIQLDELYQGLRAYGAGLDADPQRLEIVNARLAELEKLGRRYGGDLASALRFLTEAETELAGLDTAEESLSRLDAEVQEMAGKLHSLSTKLTAYRKEAAARLDEAITTQLRELGMERAVFETRIAPLPPAGNGAPTYSQTGMDSVEFLLSTNAGQAVRPLSRIASGGELSRTMLALKTVLTQADPTGTLIFDEVDAGVSGRVAEIVGRKLRALGATHQVLCVTHLPQIAALGNRHVRVSKHAEAGQTFTRAEPLDEREQVQEVARLLSGIEVTSRSLASAEEMVTRGRQAGVGS